jgi:hypothetical protein
MFRFNKKADDEGGGAAAAAAVDAEDGGGGHDAAGGEKNRRGNSHVVAAPTPSPTTSPRNNNNNMQHLMTMPLALTSSKRTLKQTALAGLPRFFTKEKARVITTTDVVLRSRKTWSVKMPPIKKHVVSGHLVPAMGITIGGRLFLQRERKICIEIHGPPSSSSSSAAATIMTEQDESRISPLRKQDYATGGEEGEITTPLKMGMMEELLEGGTPSRVEAEHLVLNDNDVVVVRILRTSHRHSHSAAAADNHVAVPDHSQSNSPSSSHEDDLSTLGPEALGDEANDGDGRGGHDVERASYRLEDVVLTKRFGRTCEIKLGSSSTVGIHHDSNTVVRDLKFESERLAMDFEQYLTRIKNLDETRIHRKVDGYRQRHLHSPSSSSPQEKAERGSSPLAAAGGGAGDADDADENTMINLLVEIVSATDLPVADLFSTDSYIKVRMGSTDIHRTKVL